MRRPTLVASALVAMSLVLSWPAASGAASPPVVSEQSERGPMAVTESAEAGLVRPGAGEKVRAIVQLSTPVLPLVGLSPTERDAQRAAIAADQDAVAQALVGTGSEVSQRFLDLPGASAILDGAGFDELTNSPSVARLRLDDVAHPMLDTSGPLVRADEAWSTATGAGYSIAILDTGVDNNHDMLAGKVVHQACFAEPHLPRFGSNGDCPNLKDTGGGARPCIYGDCEHGTHVAGIVAASDPTLNGVAPGANIVAERIVHEDNGLSYAYFSDIIRGLEDVYRVADTHQVVAANLSLGSRLYPSNCDGAEPLLYRAVQNLKDLGVATIAPSGNNAVTNGISFPACMSNVVSVGAVFSGKTFEAGFTPPADSIFVFSNAAAVLDLLAPGAPVVSSIWNLGPIGPPPPTTGERSGTSMASAHVAGAMAVLREADVGAGVATVDLVDHLRGVLRASAPCVRDPENGIDFARLDVRAALDWAGLPSAAFWDVDCNYWAEEAIDWLGHDPDGSAGAALPLAAGFDDGSFGPDLPITRGQDARMLHRLFAEPSPDGYEHGFVDVPAWITAAVNWLNWPGGPAAPDPLMTGNGSRFNPGSFITRAEKARQLYRAAGSPDLDPSCPATHGFSDVPAWVDDAVRWLTCPAHGPGGSVPIATGYQNDTFRPRTNITRAGAGRMLQRFEEAGHAS